MSAIPSRADQFPVILPPGPHSCTDQLTAEPPFREYGTSTYHWTDTLSSGQTKGFRFNTGVNWFYRVAIVADNTVAWEMRDKTSTGQIIAGPRYAAPADVYRTPEGIDVWENIVCFQIRNIGFAPRNFTALIQRS